MPCFDIRLQQLPLPSLPLWLLLLGLLSATCSVATAAAAIQPSREMDRDAPALQARVVKLRSMLRNGGALPVDLDLQLAVTLQQLNHLKPDGGSRIAEAEEAYRRALGTITALDMAIRVRGNLGALLLEAGHARDALAEFDRALADAAALGVPTSGNAGILFNRAKALSTLGELEAAHEAYVETAHIAHGADISSFAKAVAAMEVLPEQLLQLTESIAEQATAIFRRRLAAEAKDLSTLLGPDGDASILNTSSPAADGASAWLLNISTTEVSWLSFALHKFYDRHGEEGRAWPHLQHANRLMRSVQQYSVADDVRMMEQIRAVFSGSFGGTGCSDDTPIFVVGLPRSGSTLVETIFASHSDVWPAGEDTALAPLTAEVNHRLSEPGADQLAVLHQMGTKYVRQMRQLVPAQWSSDAGRSPTRIVDKMLRNLWLVGYIHLLLPKACILHAARHPMDAGLSCYQQPFGYSGTPWAWDLREIAAQINMTWQLQRHWETVLPGRVKLVFYEELVAHPEGVARELLAHCGLGWQPGVLDFHKTARSVSTASAAQEVHMPGLTGNQSPLKPHRWLPTSKVRRPLYNTSVSRWQRYKAQLEPLQEALSGAVQEYEARLHNALQARLERRRAEELSQQEHDLLSWWTPEPEEDWRDEF